jgi:hypothetical protein
MNLDIRQLTELADEVKEFIAGKMDNAHFSYVAKSPTRLHPKRTGVLSIRADVLPVRL